jgi:hypothetical protein
VADQGKTSIATSRKIPAEHSNILIFSSVFGKIHDYEYNELYFFISIENEYYRFAFDLKTGNIGNLIVSR